MSDFEDKLRAEVTRQTDSFTPSSELPERIGARVARRHRRRQLRMAAGLASGGMAAAFTAGLVLGLPADDTGARDAGELADRDDTTTVTVETPPSSAPPTTPVTEPPDDPAETAPPATEAPDPEPPEPTEPPETGAGPEATSPPSTPPPDPTTETGPQPMSGPCSPATGAVATVTLGDGAPSPGCLQVTADQSLRVINETADVVTVSFSGFSATLDPGESTQDGRAFGDYLQPGSHWMGTSIYQGPEIVLTE